MKVCGNVKAAKMKEQRGKLDSMAYQESSIIYKREQKAIYKNRSEKSKECLKDW